MSRLSDLSPSRIDTTMADSGATRNFWMVRTAGQPSLEGKEGSLRRTSMRLASESNVRPGRRQRASSERVRLATRSFLDDVHRVADGGLQPSGFKLHGLGPAGTMRCAAIRTSISQSRARLHHGSVANHEQEKTPGSIARPCGVGELSGPVRVAVHGQ